MTRALASVRVSVAVSMVTLAAAALTACGSTTTRIYGPAPDYEDPVVPDAMAAPAAAVASDAGVVAADASAAPSTSLR